MTVLRRLTLAALFSVTMAGCVHSNQFVGVQVGPVDTPFPPHPLKRYDSLQYLSCDFERGVPGQPNSPPEEHQDPNAGSVLNIASSHLKAAATAWVYSLMASNVYRDPESPQYVIPNWQAVTRWTSSSGLAVEE